MINCKTSLHISFHLVIIDEYGLDKTLIGVIVNIL